MPEEEPSDDFAWEPGFQPGWPDLYPIGLLAGRTTVTTSADVDDSSSDLEVIDERKWSIQVAVTEDWPRLAFLGDLTVRNNLAFAGVTVIMPIAVRDEPSEFPDNYVGDLLQQYGEWASSFMYDYAATVLRSNLAGYSYGLHVPQATLDVELLSESE